MLISTIFTFVSCTRVKNKDLKVNILALTESESVYFIQKADTIEYKCYIVTGDNDKISITVPYSTNDFIDDLKRKGKGLSAFPISQRQRGYRETLQEMNTFLKVILSKYSKEKTSTYIVICLILVILPSLFRNASQNISVRIILR